MPKVTVTMNLTLDGVLQAPARPDEDQRGGFTHGGWAIGYNDEVMGQAMGKGMAQTGAMLFGRRTYEDFVTIWSRRTDGNPFTAHMNGAQKYVASNTLTEPLEWQNSTLLTGDAGDAVAAMKKGDGPNMAIIGSGALARSLAARGLVDEFVLLIHPLTLGSGARLFADGAPPASYRLVDSVPTTTGVIIATYELA